MTVTDENHDEYLVVQNCEYQKTFPSFNTDTLYVICVKDVDTESLPAYKYAQKCKECIGIACKDMKMRQR